MGYIRSILVLTIGVASLASVVRATAVDVGRDLTRPEVRSIFGGDVTITSNACCEPNQACNLMYFTNPCTDPSRTSADLCQGTSQQGGNPNQCVPQSGFPGTSCDQDNDTVVCVYNYQCTWNQAQGNCALTLPLVECTAQNTKSCSDNCLSQ